MAQKVKKTILVLEDERPLLEVISKKLTLSGFEVVTARSVRQAFEYVKEGVGVDCIWLDHYLLGKESGLDFVAAIKEKDSKWKSIPIVVVSNTATHDKVHTYLQLGVNKYFTKSDFRLEQIIEEIKRLLKK